MVQPNKMSVFTLRMTSLLTQLSFYGNDTILKLEVTSTPTQFSFYGKDVIAYVIPSKVLEFQSMKTKQFVDITLDQKHSFLKNVN